MAFHSPISRSGGGRNTHFFQPPPPKTPASTSVTPSYATGGDYFTCDSGSRKRARPESRGYFPSHNWGPPTPNDSYSSERVPSSALVNERYRLAGGFDTPSLVATAAFEQPSDIEWERRRLRGFSGGEGSAPSRSVPSGLLSRERNGVGRAADETKSWMGMAFDFAGKLFSFGTNVFRGFNAGGGKAYPFPPNSGDGGISDSWQHEGVSTPLPGSWYGEDFLGDFEQDNPSFPPARPTNKRRQTDRETWVMVARPDYEEGEGSPKRKVSNPGVPNRDSLAVQRPSASRANSRKSLLPVSRRQSQYAPQQQKQTQSPLPSPSRQNPPSLPAHLGHSNSRRASLAPTRSRPSSSKGHVRTGSNGSNGATKSAGSPIEYPSPEAARYAKRRAKQERVADTAMSNMSKQLEDLIKQGQQALGTKVDVEYDDDDGGNDRGW
ncbi:hypothetical protein MBLNU230_g4265t1 [Neophaeotheca triangularis]